MGKRPDREKRYSNLCYLTKEDGTTLMLYHPLFQSWFPPGGGQEGVELGVEGMQRECGEETGLMPTNPRYMGSAIFDNLQRNGVPEKILAKDHEVKIYSATRYDEVPEMLKENFQTGWFTRDDMLSPLTDEAGRVIFNLSETAKGRIFEARFSYRGPRFKGEMEVRWV